MQFLVSATGPNTVLQFGFEDDRNTLALDAISVVLAPAHIDFGEIGVHTNLFGFAITGTSGVPTVVEASTNLASPTWSPLQTITLTNGSVYFNDPQWTNYPQRFYRLRWP